MNLKYLLISFFSALFFSFISADGATVLVIQGDQTSFGRRYFSGFSSLATERVSAFQYEVKNEAALINRIKKISPDLVFTLGEVPLKKLVSMLPSTPFIIGGYHAEGVAQKANVVLMESALPQDAGLKLAKRLFPETKTIGTIYNPRLSGDSFAELVEITNRLKVKLAGLKVDSPQDVSAFINAFSEKIDAFYWIRDSDTASDSSLNEIYKFTASRNIPVISSDPSHIERGALLSLSVDPFQLGESAWKTAAMILKEKKIPQMPVRVESDDIVLWISLGSADRFNIDSDRFYRFAQSTIKDGYSVRLVK